MMLWRARRAARDKLKNISNIGRKYPRSIAASEPNHSTISFIESTNCKNIAEIGIYEGATSLEFAKYLRGAGNLALFDYEDIVDKVKYKLIKNGFRNFNTYGCSYKYLDSYNWQLMKILKNNTDPVYDYVYLDGAHTWAIDGFTFFLVDRLLMPGGFIDFDDYNWSFDISPSLNPRVFPLTSKLYTDEQIKCSQVKLIIDLLVKRDGRYKAAIENKIYQKRG